MNKYDMELSRQRELKESFNNGKTDLEKAAIKEIRIKLLNDRKGITKKEFNELIKYYLGIDLLNKLSCECYKYGDINNIPSRELQIYSVILKSCLILG